MLFINSQSYDSFVCRFRSSGFQHVKRWGTILHACSFVSTPAIIRMAKKQGSKDDWEEIEKEITCPISYELFMDPRTLPCLHTFCKSCIQRSIETGLAEVPEGVFECPLCRAQVPLPANGVDGISANFSTKRLIEIYSKRQKVVTDSEPKCLLCTRSNPATMWCIECDCTICSECLDFHKRIKMFTHHKVIPMQEFTSDPKHAIKVFLNPGVCPAHPDQVLKFYCYTCACSVPYAYGMDYCTICVWYSYSLYSSLDCSYHAYAYGMDHTIRVYR